MPQEMRWKHQPQDLLWLHPTGAPEKLSFQKAGGQQDHSWLTLQLHEKMWKPTCANSVRAIPAVVRCRDCRPRPFFCADCDVSMHTRHPLHNRDGSTSGFFQPLPPTTYVLNRALIPCGKFWFVYKIYFLA